MPRSLGYLRSLRNEQIIAEYFGQKTVREIALKYNTTEQNVYKIVARGYDPLVGAQTDMFKL
ncbi:MAG: hypothetical protein KDJ38_04810 [Gammaproteobacteria bacterium]|nr:hypothetical protein [Gammaproteobacteria bacterium]